MIDLKYGPQQGIQKGISKQIKPFTDFIAYWSTNQRHGLKEALNQFMTEQIPTGRFISHFGRILAVRGKEMVELTESEYFPFIVLKVMDLNHLHFYFTGDRFNTFVDIYDEVRERTRVIRNFEASRISYPPGFLEERNRFLPALINSISPDFKEIEIAYKLNKEKLDDYKISFNDFRDKIFKHHLFAPDTSVRSDKSKASHAKQEVINESSIVESTLRKLLGVSSIVVSVFLGVAKCSFIWGIGTFLIVNIVVTILLKYHENKKE